MAYFWKLDPATIQVILSFLDIGNFVSLGGKFKFAKMLKEASNDCKLSVFLQQGPLFFSSENGTSKAGIFVLSASHSQGRA